MNYIQSLKKVNQCLYWLDLNARHAIELKEMFTYAAYNKSLHNSIRDTNLVRCYSVCLNALYFDFIMTLMRIYDTYERDTASVENIFKYLNEDDFIDAFEKKTQRKVKHNIMEAGKKYIKLKGSHLVARLTTVRNKLYAHTATKFNRNQFADYGQAEELLRKTLPILNMLNLSISDKVEPYDKISIFWEGYSTEFWNKFIH